MTTIDTEDDSGLWQLKVSISKLHDYLLRARKLICELSVQFQGFDSSTVCVDRTSELEQTCDDLESLRRTLLKCRELLLSTNESENNYDNNNEKSSQSSSFVMMKNEIETVRRELEQCEASLLMLQRGERIQLLPEPQKKRFIEKKKRVEETNDDDDDDDDNNNNKSFWQHSLFGKSAKTYLQKAKKKIDSVASKTKKTIKNALNEYNNKDEQQKKIEVEERYSETQRERER